LSKEFRSSRIEKSLRPPSRGIPPIGGRAGPLRALTFPRSDRRFSRHPSLPAPALTRFFFRQLRGCRYSLPRRGWSRSKGTLWPRLHFIKKLDQPPLPPDGPEPRLLSSGPNEFCVDRAFCLLFAVKSVKFSVSLPAAVRGLL